ncbi:MAG: GntR family transcriptional repressor for pyruvate dehydrogenase complex [Cocleimonas sp.]|jgi:GntR family transcriptional repressor for pyruvate dehydrogenase complex
MRVEKVKTETISDMIARQIEDNILSGGLNNGEKLPSERDLAEQFEVSRPSIREAINKLQAKGIIKKVPGGGSYICETLGASFTDPLLELLANKQDAPFDMLEMRYAIEGLSAYLAALRATKEDKELIQQRYDELLEANINENTKKEAACDVNFHLSIAMATHNPVLLHIMQSLFSVLQKSISLTLIDLFEDSIHRKDIKEQHTEILNMILTNDGEAAKTAMQKHLSWVESGVANLRNENKNQYMNREKTLANLVKGNE